MNTIEKYKKIEPFWIHIKTRSLDQKHAVTWDPFKDISIHCEHNEHGAIDISDFFYAALKKYRDLEKEGKLFVFEITAHDRDDFDFDDDGDNVVYSESYRNKNK